MVHSMITGDIKNQVDRIWDWIWSGGISNPMDVLEQLTYLLFIKRLDEIQTREEGKANTLGIPLQNPIFGPEQQHLRWSHLIKLGKPENLYEIIEKEVFPFIRTLGGEGSTFAEHMKNARLAFTPEKAGLLSRVMDGLEKIPMDDRDTKGDLYEYLLSKIKASGKNGQFRTPRHIIKMIVELMQPTLEDRICDPACGTAGFLVAALEYLQDHHQKVLNTQKDKRDHLHSKALNGFDFDHTMLRVASMNLMLHGIENPTIKNRDSLSEDFRFDREKYSLILANPPFTGSVDTSNIALDVLKMVPTNKTELMFLALILQQLQFGGRAAVIIPDGVLFGSSKVHKAIRREIIENHHLQAIISMPSGVFKPYAGVSTGIMVFSRTGTGGTENVWFYDMRADGFSLDDKRTELDQSKHDNNNIPDIIQRWRNLSAETGRSRTDQSFFVPKAEIVANGYDLSINRYKETVHQAVSYRNPLDILDELDELEMEIQAGLKNLRELLA